jgi:putative endonuclease
MFFVDILYSVETDRYYTGQTENLESRLSSHEAGISPYTSTAKDWRLVYFEKFESRTEAIKRELEIKRKKSRKYIVWLVSTKEN